MYQQTEAEKKERRRIIVAATISVVIILVLIVAIIVVATKKSSQKITGGETNTTFELAENVEKGQEEVEEEKTDKTKDHNKPTVGVISTEKNTTDANKNTTNATKSTAPATANEDNSKMPNTGPEEILPIALMAGMLVAYLSSRALAKREA